MVQFGKDLGSRRFDHPSPGYGQGPTVGGLPASFCPLSEGGGVGGQSPILSFQQELMKREMNQQLVQYHLPAQMQATVPQTRIYENLRFKGPGGSEAAGVSRGANSEISDPTAPKISEDTSLRVELPVAELNVLLKFLQTLGDLPKIELGEPASRGERLAVWRTAVEAQLRTTRKVVMDWWKWSYAGAEIYYNHWLKLPLLHRNQIKITEDMPVRFQTVEDWFFPRFLICVPTKLKDAVIQEQTYGANFHVMDVLFKLMTLMQPKGVEEQDALVKKLTNPNPCRDPTAALRELKRWLISLKRAVDIGMTLPSLELLYRGARSIYSGAFEIDDFALRLRWTNMEQMWGYPQKLSHEGLRAINEFAEAELTAMIIVGKNSGSSGLPLTDTQKQRAKGERDAEKRKKTEEKSPTKHAAAVKIGGEKSLNTHAVWAPPCKYWKEKGICWRGIACKFRHEGFKMYENGKLVDRCFVCGRSGHPTKECTAPGGGADPKKDEVWNAYKELKANKKKETKGKGRSEKSEPQDQPPTANSMIVAAAVDRDGAFPSGAAGLDSWANI